MISFTVKAITKYTTTGFICKGLLFAIYKNSGIRGNLPNFLKKNKRKEFP
jgi:hypothetical protein